MARAQDGFQGRALALGETYLVRRWRAVPDDRKQRSLLQGAVPFGIYTPCYFVFSVPNQQAMRTGMAPLALIAMLCNLYKIHLE